MTRVAITLCLALGLDLTLAASSMAAFTGLIIIPTADTVADNQYLLELQGGGSLSHRTTNLQLVSTEFGFGNRTEAGLDYGNGGRVGAGFVGNAKYVFAVDTKLGLRVATGLFNALPATKSVPYVVATQPLGGGHRLHLGFERSNGQTAWFAGADQVLGDHWLLMADHTSGVDNYSSVGFDYIVNSHVALQAGALFPNGCSDTLYLVQFMYSGSFRRRYQEK